MTKFMSRVGLWIAVLCDLYLHREQEYQQQQHEQEQGCNAHNVKSVDDKNKNCTDDDLGNSVCSSEDNGDTAYPTASSFATNRWIVYNSLKSGRAAAKARLLYYFPSEQQQAEQQQQQQ